MKSPIELLRSLWLDIQRLEPGVKGLGRDFETIEQRFKHEGYGFLAVALPAFGDALTRALSNGRFVCPAGFKLANGQAIPAFLSGMLYEVFEPSSGLLRECPTMGVIKLLREVLYLFKKIQLGDEVNEKLHNVAVAEFFGNDTIAEDHIIDQRAERHLQHVARYLLPTLCSRELDTLTFKHGPGAVAEKVKGNQKWSFLYKALTSEDFDAEKLGFTDFIYSSQGLQALVTDVFSGIASGSLNSTGTSSSIARLVSVPKNSTSVRTITVEPLLKQFVQQGLNTRLREEILKCQVLKQCLALTDQSKNQTLALEGSQTDNWATLDLKSASDLLSLKLVKLVFGHHTPFWEQMVKCRSDQVVDGKTPRSIGKFAGMGNALTFPVQSVVFATIAIAAMLDAIGRKPTKRNVMHAARHVRVFGDDIIVEKLHAHQVVHWLTMAGLKVNHKKSFLEGNFKESCGVDAFRGVNVTPLYLRFRPDNSSLEPKSIAHLVAFSNQAWLRGLYHLSTCVKDEVERRLRKRLPLVSSRCEGLGWVSRQDSYAPQKWNVKLHRFEVKTCVLVPLKRKDHLEGWPALLKFFSSSEDQEVNLLEHLFPKIVMEKHLQESQLRYKNRIRVKWVAA